MASVNTEDSDGKENLINFNFVCQRCCQPLKIDYSFSCLDQPTFAELTNPLINDGCSQSNKDGDVESTAISSDNSSKVSRKFIPPIKISGSSSGFMLIGDNGTETSTSCNLNGMSAENIGQAMQLTAKLYDIMSDQSDVDHPLCEECTDFLLNQMDHQLKIVEDECEEYKEVLKELEKSQVNEDVNDLRKQLQNLEEEEKELEERLKELEVQQVGIEEEEEKHKLKLATLQGEEQQYWKEYIEYKRQEVVVNERQRSVNNQLMAAQAHLDKLKKTNVFNATFHIWHSGHFGTINNFRLGRLPNIPIDWDEINAAWGQTVLLLHSLANKMNLQFERYRLVPYGNYSFIKSLVDDSKDLPLHCGGGYKFFWNTKFDQAMVAFLDCLQQFKEKVENGDSGFCLPYQMEKGKIIDPAAGNSYSIKVQYNSQEEWTKALKFMLTNLKWGLAWVSAQFHK